MHRQTTQAGIAIIKRFEGFKAVTYMDSGGKATIGFGHLLKPPEAFLSISQQEAEELLIKDLYTAERAVLRLTRVLLTDNQFDALVSFTFNLGSGSYQRSTLRAMLNRGEYENCATEFPKWSKCGGKTIKGLLRRRLTERDLFLS